MNFEETIKPFFWVEHEKSTSLCLSNLNYKAEILIPVPMKDLSEMDMIGDRLPLYFLRKRCRI